MIKLYKDFNHKIDKQTIVTIGMFDGVHKGHQKLLHNLVGEAKKHNVSSSVITFWPHPRIQLGLDADKLRILTFLEEKILLFERIGVDNVYLLPFNKELASYTAHQFVKTILVDKLKAKELIVGHDHRFGSDRLTSFSDYKNIVDQYNMRILQVGAEYYKDKIVSSTVIRNCIDAGNIEDANNMLGHKYMIQGKVVKGNQIGRKIGFPTANISTENYNMAIPDVGVYACKAIIDEKEFTAMVNIGFRPTVSTNADNLTIEAHIINLDEDIYNKKIKLQFFYKIRDEIQFENLEDLSFQLLKDKEYVRKIMCR